MEKLFGYARTSLVRTSETTGEHRAGCSKRPDFSPAQPRRAKTRRSAGKAAASEEARHTLRYVEPLSEARTKLADFFSILLQRWRGFSGSKRLEQHLVGDLGETCAAYAKIGEHLFQVGNRRDSEHIGSKRGGMRKSFTVPA